MVPHIVPFVTTLTKTTATSTDGDIVNWQQVEMRYRKMVYCADIVKRQHVQLFGDDGDRNMLSICVMMVILSNAIYRYMIQTS